MEERRPSLGGPGPALTAASSGPEENGVDLTGPASLKILTGVLQSFFFSCTAFARACFAVDTWVAGQPGQAGSPGGL